MTQMLNICTGRWFVLCNSKGMCGNHSLHALMRIFKGIELYGYVASSVHKLASMGQLF